MKESVGKAWTRLLRLLRMGLLQGVHYTLNIFNADKEVDFTQTGRMRRKWAEELLEKWTKARLPFFDHRIDELRWPENIFWVERGVFARLNINKGDKVLDLCCGDGYFSEVFWPCTASHIDAVDRNDEAIRLAIEEHQNAVISYHKIDILEEPFPGSDYDVVCFFEAIEHFAPNNGLMVLKKIKESLTLGGVLVGSTPLIELEEKGRGSFEHTNEFEKTYDLTTFLSAVFADVEVFETYHPNRKTGYFKCVKRK